MDRLVPLSALEHASLGVLAVDARGEVRFCSRAAARLLRWRAPPTVVRGFCWDLLRLRTIGGGSFCSTDCPIQREARGGHLAPRHRVMRVPRIGPAVEVDLVTFLVPPPRDGRYPVLHLLSPIATRGSAVWDAALDAARRPGVPPPAPPTSVLHLDPLSPRETEVLHLLVEGLTDTAIADRLFISPVTVRNHVQRILHKLGVHRRLEAVAALLRSGH